jgi:hypothetical protein
MLMRTIPPRQREKQDTPDQDYRFSSLRSCDILGGK